MSSQSLHSLLITRLFSSGRQFVSRFAQGHVPGTKAPPLRLNKDYKRLKKKRSMAEDGQRLPWWTRAMRWTQTSAAEAVNAEQKLLGLIPTPLRVHDVRVGSHPKQYLHTMECPHPSPSPSAQPTSSSSGASTSGNPPVVMMPGYGAGAGFYFRNLAALSSHFKLYAVDWLGTGLSGRPPYTPKSREQAESWFLDSLSTWRKEVGLEGQRMVLVGHSLGGYLAAAYALKHPEHVAHLVLVCPAGVPRAPEDWQRKFLGKASGMRAAAFKTAMWAWEKGVTPQSIIRGLGPWGPGLCERYVVNRFAYHGNGLSHHEVSVFKDYFYQIAAASGSGEYALRHLLAPGAWAHAPLADRLRELQVPVTFIYGRHDWMRPEHAVDLVKELRAERAPKVPTDLHVEIVDDAGHFVFMDQPAAFNRALLHAVAPHMSAAGQQAAAAAQAGGPVGGHTAESTSWGHAQGHDPTAPQSPPTTVVDAST